MQATRPIPIDEQPSGDIVPFAGPEHAARRRDSARSERVLALCEGMIDIAAALFNVSSKELRQSGRCGLPVCRVRQIAMYVAHVALQMSMREVASGFSRDRTTVVYACHLIEDMRDDPDFDQIVAMTERVAVTALGGGAGI